MSLTEGELAAILAGLSSTPQQPHTPPSTELEHPSTPVVVRPVQLALGVTPHCRACPERLDAALVDAEDGGGLHYGCVDPGPQDFPSTPASSRPDTGKSAGRRSLRPETLAAHGRLLRDTVAAISSSADYRIDGNSNPVNIDQDQPVATVEVRDLAAVAAGLAEGRPDALTLKRQDVHDRVRAPHPPMPPSTVRELHGVLTRFDAQRPRSRQVALGPSELGTPCDLQIALKLAAVAQRPESQVPWAAIQGTAMHVLMADVLAWANSVEQAQWTIEQRLQVDDEIGGAGDAYDGRHAMVVDWKYTGSTALRKVARTTVPNADLVTPDYRVQAHLYGWGHEAAGRPVDWVRLVFLARSHDFGDSREWTERYDPQVAVDAMTRFYAIRETVVNVDGARDPRRLDIVAAAPDKDTCKWCPFKRPGGPVDATGCPGDTQARFDEAVRRAGDGIM